MRRILMFGNSGSGKSTFARHLCEAERLAHLDLDTLAWVPTSPPERRLLEESRAEILAFIEEHAEWVIEGCYADLLEQAAPHANEAIYLDLPVEVCLANARSRPFEPHKYDTPQAQEADLPMLLTWIGEYETRDDVCSAPAHRALFHVFHGRKQRYTDRPRWRHTPTEPNRREETP